MATLARIVIFEVAGSVLSMGGCSVQNLVALKIEFLVAAGRLASEAWVGTLPV